jgi:hypothetical protein
MGGELDERAKWNREDAHRAHAAHDAARTVLTQASITSAQSAVQTAVLINGGAAAAMLAFIGGLATQGKITSEQMNQVGGSLLWFVWGAALGGIAMALAYLTNRTDLEKMGSVQKLWEQPYITNTRAARWWRVATNCFLSMSLIATSASIILFIMGMVDVRYAISHLSFAATVHAKP